MGSPLYLTRHHPKARYAQYVIMRRLLRQAVAATRHHGIDEPLISLSDALAGAGRPYGSPTDLGDEEGEGEQAEQRQLLEHLTAGASQWTGSGGGRGTTESERDRDEAWDENGPPSPPLLSSPLLLLHCQLLLVLVWCCC